MMQIVVKFLLRDYIFAWNRNKDSLSDIFWYYASSQCQGQVYHCFDLSTAWCYYQHWYNKPGSFCSLIRSWKKKLCSKILCNTRSHCIFEDIFDLNKFQRPHWTASCLPWTFLTEILQGNLSKWWYTSGQFLFFKLCEWN